MINQKIKNKYLYLIIFFLFLLTFAFNSSAKESYIYDNAKILDYNIKSKIININSINEENNKPKFIIHTTNSLKNKSIVNYSNEVFSRFLKKEIITDNDILIILSTQPNIAHIHIGNMMSNQIDTNFVNDLLEQHNLLITNNLFVEYLNNVVEELNFTVNSDLYLNNLYIDEINYENSKSIINANKNIDLKSTSIIIILLIVTIILIADIYFNNGKYISSLYSKLYSSNKK